MTAALVHLDGQVYVDPASVVVVEPLDPSRGTRVWVTTPTENLRLTLPMADPAEVAAKLRGTAVPEVTVCGLPVGGGCPCALDHDHLGRPCQCSHGVEAP